jgi:hypothetical protein
LLITVPVIVLVFGDWDLLLLVTILPKIKVKGIALSISSSACGGIGCWCRPKVKEVIPTLQSTCGWLWSILIFCV